MKKNMIFALEKEMRKVVNLTPEYDFAVFRFETLMADYGVIELENRRGTNWYEVKEKYTNTTIHITFDKYQCVRSIGYYSKDFNRGHKFKSRF